MNVMKKRTVIIADDHPLFRDGVKQALSRDPELSVVAVAGDGEEALRVIREHSPDVAILDMNMPKKTGLEVARSLVQQNNAAAVIFLTMFDDEEILNEAMSIGVKGYLLKESASMEIANAVHAVAGGRYYISAALTDKLVRRNEKRESFTASHPQLAALTEQERKILKLIAESKTSKEIAALLFLSQKTIENYRFKISEKLGLSGSYSLLKFAIEHKSLL